MLEQPKLFLNYKEFLFTLFCFILILAIRFGFIYSDYQSFISKPFYFTTVDVLQQYNRKKYTTLKVYSKSLNLHFFTTIYRETNLCNRRVRLKLFPSKDMSFIDYLTSPYIKSKINRIEERSRNIKEKVLEKIAQQHQLDIISEFYHAIFLAQPVSKELRVQLSKFGINHLVALSGFHLGILSALIVTLLNPIYKFFQQRYFPYRYTLIDIGCFVLIILIIFIWFVNSPASLIRSYIMMLMGWIALVTGIELISFSFLTTAVMVVLVIFPKMSLSLAFWFSVAGVFYIYLLIDRFNIKNRFLITLYITFAIFILMSPIIHIVFSITTPLQLYSPILSLIFIIFYPLSILLHTLNLGWVFDTALLKLFSITTEVSYFKLSPSDGTVYIFLSIISIYSKWIFYLLFIIALLFNYYSISTTLFRLI